MTALPVLRYLLLAGDPDWRLRHLAILAVLGDTVTTLYALYVAPLPLQETNPLGGFLLEQGFPGEILFMSIPLFSILLFLYLPGLLGDAVAAANIIVHGFATGINLLHSNGTALVAVTGIPVMDAYIAAITVGSGIGIAAVLPQLYARYRATTP